MRGGGKYDLSPVSDCLRHSAVVVAGIGGVDLYIQLAAEPLLYIFAPMLMRARPCAALRIKGIDESDVQMICTSYAEQL